MQFLSRRRRALEGNSLLPSFPFLNLAEAHGSSFERQYCLIGQSSGFCNCLDSNPSLAV